MYKMQNKLFLNKNSGDEELFSNKLRFLNLFLVITIVLSHVSYHCNGEDWITNIYRKGTLGTMGWFFFASSFWYFKRYCPKLFVKKFTSRLKTLFVPYIIFNFVAVLLNFDRVVCQPQGVVAKINSLLKSFVFIENSYLDILPLDGPTWYIARLLTFFFVSPLIYYLLKNKCVGIVSLIGLFYFTLNGKYYWFNGFLFVFCLGAFFSMHYKDEFVKLLTKYTYKCNSFVGLVIFIALYSGISIVLIQLLNRYSPMMAMNTFLQFLLSAVCIAFVNVPRLSPKWGGYAFLLFCEHILWVIPLKKIFDLIDTILKFNYPGIRATVMSVIILICTITSAKIIENVFPTLYKCLTGNRG